MTHEDTAPASGAPAAHADELTFAITVARTPEAVFAALTDARQLERWFCDRAASDPVALGRLEFTWNRGGGEAETWEGRWTLVEPPHACVYEGGHAGYPERYSGRVRFSLARDGAGTRLDVLHQFPARAPWAPFVVRYREAWPRALARLAAHLDREDAR